MQDGAEGDRDCIDRARLVDDEIGPRVERKDCEGREVNPAESDRGADGAPGRNDLSLGRQVHRSRRRSIQQGLELHAVEPSPTLESVAPDRPLATLALREQEWPRQQDQRVRDQARVWLQQPSPRIESVVSRISSSKGSLPMSSATSRSAGSGSSIFLDHAGISVTRSCTPLATNTRSATSAMSLASTAYTCRAPARLRLAGDRQHPAAGTQVEHDISGLNRCCQRGQVVARPTIVVEHASVLDRIGPAADRARSLPRLHERAFLDQHVDDAQRRDEVRGLPFFVLEPVDCVPESHRLGNERQDLVSPWPQIDNRPVRTVDEDVTSPVEPGADTRRQRKLCLRRKVHLEPRSRLRREPSRRPGLLRSPPGRRSEWPWWTCSKSRSFWSA